jgi:hypothetical protein
MVETRNLRKMAGATAEFALQLAARPADGLLNDVQALDEIERLAARIMREASTVRAGATQTSGEARGT